MPFTLAFGNLVVMPVEISMATHRVCHFNPRENDEALEEHLYLLEEKREETEVQNIMHKRRLECYFNKQVKPKSFKIGDIVLKETGVTT